MHAMLQYKALSAKWGERLGRTALFSTAYRACSHSKSFIKPQLLYTPSFRRPIAARMRDLADGLQHFQLWAGTVDFQPCMHASGLPPPPVLLLGPCTHNLKMRIAHILSDQHKDEPDDMIVATSEAVMEITGDILGRAIFSASWPLPSHELPENHAVRPAYTGYAS